VDNSKHDHRGIMSVIYNLEELAERFTVLGERHRDDHVVSIVCSNTVYLISLFLIARLISSHNSMTLVRNEYARAVDMLTPQLVTRSRYTLHLMEETLQCMTLECHTLEEKMGLE